MRLEVFNRLCIEGRGDLKEINSFVVPANVADSKRVRLGTSFLTGNRRRHRRYCHRRRRCPRLGESLWLDIRRGAQ